MQDKKTYSLRKSILIYICVWLFLSIAHTLWTEPLIVYLFPGLHNIRMFVYVWMGGLIVISGVTMLALAVRIVRVLRQRKRSRLRVVHP